MIIDQNKLKRQKQVISKWKAHKAKGTLEAVTGFGKTFVAILVIQEMNLNKPERTARVIVPTNYLRKQWEGLINEFKLKNVEVLVINTAVKQNITCDLLILDEVHNYVSRTFKTIFRVIKYKFILGLTATMERADNRHILLESYCPIIDTINMDEALRHKYVSDFRVFNLGITMNKADAAEYKRIGTKFGKFFSMFGHDFDTAMRCLSDKAYCALYAKNMGWTPEETFVFALNFNRNMQARKKFLYYASSKLDAAEEIIKTFNVPAITFSESTDFSDLLTERLPKQCVSYHSKLGVKKKREALKSFKDGRTTVNTINTAKALDEGFDIAGIMMALICSGTSSQRQDLQRTGRAIRFSKGKLGMIINLYIKDTQDYKWLLKRQQKTRNIIFVESIAEIEDIMNELKLAIC